MSLRWKRKLLLLYVRFFHRGQRRKYADEYYYHHPVRVAEAADKYYPESCGYEVGLCHDLLEDTKCTSDKLGMFLYLLGYDVVETQLIVEGVIDLTDVYTKENFPGLNRGRRKQMEAVRLSKCSKFSQTIKFCDFEDNTSSIVSTAPKFAKVYLKEKRYALNLMVLGDQDLRNRLIEDTNVYTMMTK